MSAAADQSIDPLDLLQEWYEWWWDTDEAPTKMPAALHVRSAIALLQAGRIVPGQEAQL